MKKIFNYIFYMSYIKEKNKRGGVPLLNAVLSVSLVFNLVVFIISLIFSFFIDIYTNKVIMLPVILIFEIFVAIISYYIYGYKKKYLKITEIYRGEDEKIRKKNRLTVTLFIIFLLLIMTILFIVSVQLYKQRHGIVGYF